MGMMGILTEISEDEDSNPLARIVFPDGRSVLYEADQMDMVEHANAITIHKSQGNECQVVIIPWVWAFYKMLKRNILYTGITRAKQKVYLVGEKKAITVAIKQESTGTRNTILAERSDIIVIYIRNRRSVSRKWSNYDWQFKKFF